MARSIGEAIATGIDTGFSRVQQYQQQREAKARQDRLDQEQSQDRATARQRQADADALGAMDQQELMLADEGRGLTNADQGTQQEFTGRVRSLQNARGQLLKRTSGVDVNSAIKAGTADLQALQSGQVDIHTLAPGALARAVTVSTGRDPADYIRPPGGMAPVEQAGTDVVEGLQSGDMKRVVGGLNVLHAPELRTGVGSDSKHGKIVAKQIINVVPDPNSKDPQDPSVIPIMRVYVNSGKDFRGPLPPDVPEGSTGYYDAPLTERRSSDPDDPVKSIKLKDFMGRLSKQMQAVEMLNSPPVLEKLQQDQGAWNPSELLEAQNYLNRKNPKKFTTTLTPIPAGGSLLVRDVDASGKPVSERRIEGNTKPTAPARVGATQEKIDALNGQRESNGGPMSDEEVDAAIESLAKTVTTPRPLGRGAGGGGGGSGGNLQSTKVGSDGFMIGVFRDGSVRQLMLDGKPIKAQDYAKRVDKLAADIAKSVDGIGKSAKDVRAEAEQTLAAKAETGPAPAPGQAGGKAAPKVLKFDKQGNLVK